MEQNAGGIQINLKQQKITSKVHRCFKCKYCSLNFHGQSHVKLFNRHIRNHEKRYLQHWLKRMKRTCSIAEDNRKTCLENVHENYGKRLVNKSDEASHKMISKEVFVYIVFAPEGVCKCIPDTQRLSTALCDCEFRYRNLIFNSIEHMHKMLKEDISYDCPKCKKKVLAEKLQNNSLKTCPKCNDKFGSVESLNDHQQACYGFKQLEPSFQCLQCSYKAEVRTKMIAHASAHSSKDKTEAKAATFSRPEDCREASVQASKNLNFQMKTPTRFSFNPYPCPICGKRYPDSSKLKQHVMTHQQKGDASESLKERTIQSPIGKGDPRETPTRCKRLSGLEESESFDEYEMINKETSPKSGMSLRPRKQTNPPVYCDDILEDMDDQDDTDDNNDGDDDDDNNNNQVEDKSLPHKCNYCERAFKREAYLQNHKQTMHSGKSPFVCLVCLKRFQLQDDFSKHSKSHKNTIFKCQFCSAKFNKMELLHNHDQTHSNDKPFNCTVCGATFLNARSLSKHFKTHLKWDVTQHSQQKDKEVKEISSFQKSNLYVCPICKALFDSAQDLKKHSKVHEVERFKCKLCLVTCKSRLDLLNHAKRHKHKCQFCELDFLSLAACKKHEQTHMVNTTLYKCSYCPKEFKFKSDHKIHESLHAQFDGKHPETKKFKCKFCGKGLAYQRDLKIHELLHEAKPKLNEHFCDHCGRKFDNKTAMQRHRHNHFRDKLPAPTKCPDCDKIFKYGSLFREHKKIHWPEKPFECMYCKTRFKTKPELEGHEAVHTVGKDHACPICSRRFTKKKNVRIHLRTHTGEKPYACAYCPKKFPQTSLRRRHERLHTGECPYVCDICHRSFPYDSSLKVHYEAHKKKGLKVPLKFGMATGLRRKYAPSRKPPCVTKGKDPPKAQLLETKSDANTSTSINTSVTVNLEQQEAIAEPSHTLIPAPVPMSIAQNQQAQDARNIQQNTSAPIQVTIQPAPIQLTIQQGEHMHTSTADHHSVHHNLMQRQDELHSPESSWEALHSRYLQPTTVQNWQSSHNWQPISQQLQSPPNWEVPAGNWAGPPPPTAHQGQSSAASVITSALYGIVQRDNDGQRGYQQ